MDDILVFKGRNRTAICVLHAVSSHWVTRRCVVCVRPSRLIVAQFSVKSRFSFTVAHAGV